MYVLLSWLSMGEVSAAPQDIGRPHFRNYQTEHGLLHNSVNCVLEDRLGFIWIGTQNGLNRFDGHSFVPYNLPDNKFYLGGNMVYSLHEGLANDLWIGTSQGIYRFDRESQELSRLESQTKFHVHISTGVVSIAQTADSTLWIGTSGQGLFRYQPAENKLTQISTRGSYVTHLVEDKAHDRMLVATLDQGLMSYTLNGEFSDRIRIENSQSAASNEIRFLQYMDGKVWFSSSANSFSILQGDQISRVEHPAIGVVRCAAMGGPDEIFLGTDKGVYAFYPESGEFTALKGYTDNIAVSLNQLINGLTVDREGGLWVATDQSGLLYKKKDMFPIETYLPTPDLASPDNFIEVCVEDPEGNLYVGTQSGLYRLRVARGAMEKVGPSNIQVSALLLNGQDLWVGTKGSGILILDPATGKVTRTVTQSGQGTSFSSNEITALYRDKKGRIFIGTTRGLGVYNSANGKYRPLSVAGTMVSVSCIQEDHLGYLWVATENAGLFRIDGDNHYHYQHYFQLDGQQGEIPSNSIIAMDIGPGGKVWIGTNGAGVFYFDRASDSFIDANDRLNLTANRIVYAIQEEQSGHLWMATSAGIIRSSQQSMHWFDQTDGLRSSLYSANAVISAGDGTIYFGGNKGLTAFKPSSSDSLQRQPSTLVTSVRVLQTDTQETPIKTTDGYAQGDLAFAAGENNLEFSFSTLSYQKPGSHLYRYMLSGVDQQWRLLTGKNSIEYTDLAPGKYTLYLWGTTNGSSWPGSPTEFNFRIATPWWQAPWCYGAGTLIFALVIVAGARKLNARHHRVYKKKLDRYKQRKEHDLYQSKVRFFVNLVHEIRTPLTLISVPLQRMQQAPVSENDRTGYLHVMEKNLNHLMGIVNELLDFQKLENSRPVLRTQQVNLVDFMSSFKVHFQAVAKIRQVVLSDQLPGDPLWCAVDKQALRKVLFNLVGNALKHTKDRIELSVRRENGAIGIEVKDNGSGIPQGERDQLFEPFARLSNATREPGSGVGLFYSKMLIDAMDGRMETRSNEWGGASFWIWFGELTDLQPVETRPAEMIQPADPDPIPPEHMRAHLLLIEDNLELRTMLKEALGDDYIVSTARHGEDGLKILEQQEIDVIISDVMMPQMDGLDFARFLRSDLAYCHIPLIMLTARTDVESKEDAMLLGADVYVEKPVSLNQLRLQVRNFIARRYYQHRKIQQQLLLPEKREGLSPRDEAFMEELLAVIGAHITDLSFNIDALAEQVHMSRSNFYRKIRGLTGLSPNAYLRLVRIQRAAELLQEDGCRINEVYQQVGFSSSSYFAKCFRDHYGLSPSEFLRQATHQATAAMR